jgi:hypothetical protein
MRTNFIASAAAAAAAVIVVLVEDLDLFSFFPQQNTH